MINICLALHDKDGSYAKNTAVTMASVFLNTKEDVTAFLLHDDTLKEETKDAFKHIADSFCQKVEFYHVDALKVWSNLLNVQSFTVGTMFRLMIPNLLPDDVDRVIYLDSDIVVNIDIKELWEQKFGSNIILGRKELHYDNPIFDQGVSEDSYINAGVLVMDLKRIRQEHSFLEETTGYLKKHPDCMWNDEDAINYVLNKKQGLITDKYNYFTSRDRMKDGVLDENRIFHFAGDYPRISGEKYYDRLYFSVLERTPFGKTVWDKSLYYFAIDFYNKKMKELQNILKRINNSSEIIFWGAKETLKYNELKDFFDFSCKRVLFIDKNEALQGKSVDGFEIKSTEIINNSKNSFIIVLAYRHFDEISKELEDKGLVKNEDFASVEDIAITDSWMKTVLDEILV